MEVVYINLEIGCIDVVAGCEVLETRQRFVINELKSVSIFSTKNGSHATLGFPTVD